MPYRRRRKDTRVVLQSDFKRFLKYLKDTVPELSHIHDNLLPFLFYSRRVDMRYIIPERGELEHDPLVKEEGLYPATIIPDLHRGGRVSADRRVLAIRVKEEIVPREFEGPSRLDNKIFGRDSQASDKRKDAETCADAGTDSRDYQEEPYMLIQNPVRRYVVSSKSRIYYEKDRWYTNTTASDVGLCSTLIFPEELVGDIVGLINLDL